jgi:hypothetical protein
MTHDPVKWNRDKALERKILVIVKLGAKCVKCGFSDLRALQIDHIAGGGAQELLRGSTQNRRHYYKKVLESIAAKENKYQLLCANCNWIKRWENKEFEQVDRL